MRHRSLSAARTTTALSICLILALSAVLIAQEKRAPTHGEIARNAALEASADQLKKTLITAHLDEKIEKGTNLLWCATFQLAWNELCDLTGGPIDVDGASPMVDALNKRSVTAGDIDAESFVAMAGKVEEGILEEIARALEEKFRGLASPELLPAPGSLPISWYVTYAYLFKQLPFEYAFTRWRRPAFFGEDKVAAFGIDQLFAGQKNEVKMATQVSIIDFKSNDDFLVEMKTKSKKDRLVLAKIPPAKTLAATIDAVHSRLKKGKRTTMGEMETLWIPVLDFDLVRDYDEIIRRKVATGDGKASGLPIAIARQSIRFRLDETGAMLKSEAIGALGGLAKSYFFNKPFLVLLERRGARNPYFALWVDNAELLVPFAGK